MAEKKVIKKTDWVANFSLIGRPIVNDFTFTINGRSQKSNWIYNAMNLKVDCGEKYGVIDAKMMGGYSEDNENRIFAHGKRDDKTDDFDKQIIVDWADRFDDEILEEIGSMSFIDIGLEKTDKGFTFVKHFLSEYDAIAYAKEHLKEDMIVNVRGRITYSLYNDTVQVNKNITSIKLFDAEDSSKYKATFTQTILIDNDSANLRNIDKDKGVMFVDARVLDYLKEYNGVEVKGQYPYKKQFEFKFPDLGNEKQCKAIYEGLFKVKKDVTQITFEGDFVEGGAAVTTTWEDVPDEIKGLVEMGIFSKEEALAKCTVNGGREKRMVLTKPATKQVGDEDAKVTVIRRFEERYTEDDLYLDFLYKDDDDSNKAEEESDTDNGMDWLNAL